MARHSELAVDRIRCDGRGLCHELFPEMIALDDWGYPMLAPGPVPRHLMSHARRAVAACPVLALRLQPVAKLPANSEATVRRR
jgi:ferredoxin